MTIEEKLKYPIGQFNMPQLLSKKMLLDYINEIASFPSKIKKEVDSLNDLQLDTPYRPNGWTIRQVVNHCADSHMNSLIRVKLALTEDKPTIKPYMEERWAELIDSKVFPIDASLKIIEGVHARWVFLLNNLSETELNKMFIHPASGKEIKISESIANYSWHCNHHLAHITNLKTLNGWT